MTAEGFDGLEVLFEASGGDGAAAPGAGELERLYGGALDLPPEAVVANFVTSIDGVVALRSHPRSSALISGGSPADRFVMGLLRAWADAVVVGAGTIRAHAGGRWTAAAAYPPAAEAFAAMRSGAGRPGDATLVVVTASGSIDPDHPAMTGALVATTTSGADALRRGSPAEVMALGGTGDLDPRALVHELRARGFRRILTEGGPLLMGRMLRERVVTSLFLTLSPVIAGRSDGDDRAGFVDGTAFGPEDFPAGSLRSARRWSDQLFLRYDLDSGRPARGTGSIEARARVATIRAIPTAGRPPGWITGAIRRT